MGKSNNIHWGKPREASLGTTFWKVVGVGAMVVGLLSIIPGMIPLLGNALQTPIMAVSHFIERFRNNSEAKDELTYRAQYYSPQIFKTLGVQPREGRQATVSEFKAAANINPELAKLYAAPVKKASKENNVSAASTGAMLAVGMVTPGGAEGIKAVVQGGKLVKGLTAVAHTAKAVVPHIAASMAGGALASALSGETVDPQMYLEAIDKTVAEARAKGMDVRQVVTPQMIFLLRVAQDEKFAESIKTNFKKSFHEMNEAEQTQVMQAYPALANAATSEAYAVAKEMIPVQELGASKPNLNAQANAYAVGARNSSFADRVTAQRAALAQRPAGISA